MKIGILSDSHDHRENIRKAVDFFNKEEVEQVIHTRKLCEWFTGKATVAILETKTNEVTIHEL